MFFCFFAFWVNTRYNIVRDTNCKEIHFRKFTIFFYNPRRYLDPQNQALKRRTSEGMTGCAREITACTAPQKVSPDRPEVSKHTSDPQPGTRMSIAESIAVWLFDAAQKDRCTYLFIYIYITYIYIYIKYSHIYIYSLDDICVISMWDMQRFKMLCF